MTYAWGINVILLLQFRDTIRFILIPYDIRFQTKLENAQQEYDIA